MSAVAIFGLRQIADRFDHVLLDQWGALHEGKAVFPAAYQCVARLRAAGKRVLTLSNSGKRADDNARRLARLGLPPEAYDGMLTSGEVTWSGLAARNRDPFEDLGQSCFLITRGGDRSVVDGLALHLATDLRNADFILLAGLDDADAEPSHWRERLKEAAMRGIPMLCANPDLKMFGADGTLIPAPGAIAELYRSLGGTVRFVGKPHAPIFTAALARLGDPMPSRVLVVGDSLDHDIAGGRAAGMLTLLICAGVHRDALANAPDLPQALRNLAGSESRMPDWTMEHLTW